MTIQCAPLLIVIVIIFNIIWRSFSLTYNKEINTVSIEYNNYVSNKNKIIVQLKTFRIKARY